MRALAAVALLAFGLAGCAEFNTAAKVVATDGARAADTHYAAAKWTFCNAQTSGAIMRNVWGTSSWEHWAALCWPGKKEFPTAAPAPSPAN